jgi:hypothetical protein
MNPTRKKRGTKARRDSSRAGGAFGREGRARQRVRNDGPGDGHSDARRMAVPQGRTAKSGCATQDTPEKARNNGTEGFLTAFGMTVRGSGRGQKPQEYPLSSGAGRRYARWIRCGTDFVAKMKVAARGAL